MPSYPNRCQHIKVNGTQCGSPALRRNRFCYFHKRHHDERIELNADRKKNARARRRSIAIDLPVFEDANSIQVSLMQITRLLIAGDLDAKTAGLILYALQTASSNLGRTRFEPRMHDVILDPTSVGETALGAHAGTIPTSSTKTKMMRSTRQKRMPPAVAASRRPQNISTN
jgi:hypothetical protein